MKDVNALRQAAIQAARAAFDTREQAAVYYRALTGDGVHADTNVAGRPYYTWVRYAGDDSKASQVLNIVQPNIDPDVTVIIGKNFPYEHQVQILRIDTSLYTDTFDADTEIVYGLGKHGKTHNAAGGSDPAPIDLRNIVEGRCQPTSPASESVVINPFRYDYGTHAVYAGETFDLTPYEPAVGNHALILVYVDPETNAAAAFSGLESLIGIGAIPPTVPSRVIPICLVDYEHGDTEITEEDFYDYRTILSGSFIVDHLHSGVGDGGASLVDLQELFFADAVSLQIYETAITPSQVYHKLSLLAMYLGDADLAWIWPDVSYGEGQILILRPDPALSMYGESFSLRIIHGEGNIHLNGEQDVYLDNAHDHLMLIYDGEYWCDLSISPSTTRSHQAITADYSLSVTDDILFVDASGGDITISLPNANSTDQDFTIKRIDDSANTVTVQGSQDIDGEASQELDSYDSMVVASNGTEWYIL